MNYLLQADYLPVDVAPVTAAPTRVSYGPHPQIRIELADSPSLIVQFSDLWDFATERGNPNNAKHVTRIHISLPSPKLTEGIIFVDTPGLGTHRNAYCVTRSLHLWKVGSPGFEGPWEDGNRNNRSL